MDLVYLPGIADAKFVRNYFFPHPEMGPCSCVLVTGCKSEDGPAYAHAFYVYERGDFLTGRPCFAVAAEINKLSQPGDGRSHFLGVFPGGPEHINQGASDEWADLEKFERRAIEVVMERFSLGEPPKELPVPAMMLQRFRVPRSYPLGGAPAKKDPDLPTPRGGITVLPPKKWWEFWK